MMKKILHVSIALILCLTLYLCLMPSAHAASSSGTWGNLRWTLDSSGTLTITGSGAMKDFTGNIQMPDAYTIIYEGWHDPENLNRITSVVIKPGVTTIGFLAFSDCKNLDHIYIPESVTGIQAMAFDNCTSLQYVDYGGTQQQYGEIIMNSYGNESFLSVPTFYNVSNPTNVSTYTVTYNANGGSGAPASQTKTHGQTLTLSTTKPTRANSSAGSYTVTLDANGGSVSTTSLTAARTTSYTFKNWNTAANGSGTSYASGASFTTDANTTLYAQWNSSTSTASVTLPTPTRDGYTFKGWAASSSASSGTTGSYTPSENVTLYAVWKEESALYTSGQWGSLNWTLTEDGLLTISGTGKMNGFNSSSTSAWLAYKGRIKAIEIEFGVTSIGDYAFYKCSGLTSVTIPSSVTSICNYAFRGCSSLTSVTIPDSVTNIGNYAFYGCSGLTSVTIPDSVTSIGSSAFSECSGLNAVRITSLEAWCKISFSDSYSNPLYYVNNLYLNDTLIQELTIPEGVTSICNYAFCGCSSLTSVTIPSSVTSIGGSAFYGCSGLNAVRITSLEAWCKISFSNSYSNPLYYANNLYLNDTLIQELTIPEGVTSIGKSAFSFCSGLTSVTIPVGVTSIGQYAFYKCSGLTSITIPESVTSIGYAAFSGCSSLTSVTIPDSVAAIGYAAFSGCSGLTKVHINSLSAWCSIAFKDSTSNPLSSAHNLYIGGNLVQELMIPDSVTSIGNYAFVGCSGLTSVTIPSSVTSIGDYAFYNCSSLKNVFYGGSPEQWSSITIGINNTPLQNATIIYKPDLILPASLTTIEDEAFIGGAFTYVKLPESCTSIGWHAFADCPNLKYISIPDGCAIDDDAFSGVSGLTILGKSGGGVQTWAGEHGYSFIPAA